ncbi:hypothetical protein MRX96_007003 [Rhipicephalus microplus]
MAGPLVVTTVPTSAQNLPWPDLGFPAMTPMPETFDAATLGSQLNTGTKSYPPRLVTECDFGGQHRATRRAGDTPLLQKPRSLWNQLGHATTTITVMRLPLFAQVFALAIMAGPLVVTTVPTSARNLPWPDCDDSNA